ncbi:hypothetical protein GEMRC1_011541 [Eukaryota sp. GEM-RC1]
MDPNFVISNALAVHVPEFVPSSNVQIDTDEKVEEKPSISQEGPSVDELISSIPNHQSLTNISISPVDLDKDKDELGHMDLITACSNLRATNYYIPTADKHRTRGIAGKIVPAMVTTTALVVGMVSIELLKLLQEKNDIEAYCDSFLNLALPFIARSSPETAPTTDMMGKKFTVWDKLYFDCGDVTLGEFIDLFQKTYKLSVCMLTIGKYMVFSEWPSNKALQERRLQTPLSKVVEEFQKKPLPPGTMFVNLVVLAFDEVSGDDVECPPVQIKIR